MSEIKSTTNYGIFKKLSQNRELSTANLKKLKVSIESCNLLQFKPIVVDKDMAVIDGSHRLEVAKQLNVPIYYTINVSTSTRDMILLNSAQKMWTTDDYINFYAQEGDEDFKAIRRFCSKHSLNAHHFCNLAGIGYSSRQALKFGKLGRSVQEIMKDIEKRLEFLEEVKGIISSASIQPLAFLNSSFLQRAFCTLLSHDDFDKDLFIEKLKINVGKFYRCSNVPDYLKMLKDIYNYKNHNKILN